MTGRKQTTLFQSWGSHGQRKGQQETGKNAAMADLEDEEDAMLARALEESLRTAQPGHPAPEQFQASTSADPPAVVNGPSVSSKAQWAGLFQQHGGASALAPPQPSMGPPGQPAAKRGRKPAANAPIPEPDAPHIVTTREISEDHLPDPDELEAIPGLDRHASRLWIYPTNYPVRSYQLQIVHHSLFENTLVVLPTGLGKTFIAAVVMYNYYRWYPRGKIVFMAPTKPLVAQQIEACYNIMGIPQDDTAEMTGTMMPAERKRAWETRRVFFLTPQTMNNDLARGACPANSMKCLVIDEAHKALGNHAYCQVVRELAKHTEQFRVLALSATPGGDIKTVQQVISNLLVAHVEVRSDESPDIQPYQHERLVEKIVVPLGEEVSTIRTKYLRILEQIVQRLRRHGAMYGNRDVSSLGKFMILKAREAFRQNPSPNMQPYQYGMVEGDFALCMSLYHGYELLQQHGLRSLLTYLDSLQNGSKGSGRCKAELNNNVEFVEIMDMLHDKYKVVVSALPQSQVAGGSGTDEPFAYSHPKLKRLEEILLDHFQRKKGVGDDGDSTETRVMIFSQLRDSVNEITEMLRRHHPLVRVMSFVGQSQGKVSKGFTQAEQLKVMRGFRSGGYNTLVSTCVGEEGLDIGEVDLIVCYDAQKSPIRLIQRMGRTGRKRKGRIVMMMAEGKEEQMYNQSQVAKRSIYRHIQSGNKLKFYARSPRLVPEGLDPVCHQMHITVTDKFQQNARRVESRKPSVKTTSKSSTSVPAGSKREESSDGLLTPEQLQYWSEHYKVEETPPVVMDPQMLSVKLKKRPDKSDDVNDQATFDLSAWTPWQNRLQEIHVVEHSMRSRHLVELMEFMEVQAAGGEDCDDYEREMAKYLNKEDISPSKNVPANSILRYTEMSQEAALKKTGYAAENEKGKRKRVRQTIELEPILSDTEEKSDEDLPDFTEIIRKGKSSSLDIVEDQTDCGGPADCELQGLMQNNDMEVISNLGEISRKVFQKKKDSKKKRRLKRSNGGNVSCIQPIVVDSDEGDFEGQDTDMNMDDVFMNKQDYSVKVEAVNEFSGDLNSDVLNPDPIEEDMTDPPSEEVGREADVAAKEAADVAAKEAADVDEILQLLPSVTPLKFTQCHQINPPDFTALPKAITALVKKKLQLPQAGDPLSADKTKSESPVKSMYSDPSNPLTLPPIPPGQAEIDEALANLADRDTLSPVDLVSLVDQWEQERGREGCTELDSQEPMECGDMPREGCTELDSEEPMECGDMPPSLPFDIACDAESSSESSHTHVLPPKASVPWSDIRIEGIVGRSSQGNDLIRDFHNSPGATMEPSLSDSQFVLAMDDGDSEDLFQDEGLVSPSKEILNSITNHGGKRSNHVRSSIILSQNNSSQEWEYGEEPFKSYCESPKAKSVKHNPVAYVSHSKKISINECERIRSASSSSGESVIVAGNATMSDTKRAVQQVTPSLVRQAALRPDSTSTPLDMPRSRPFVPNRDQPRHVSFFEDGDDSLLAAVETPQAERISSASISLQTPVSSAHNNSSVLTFTQAMACLHNSMDASHASQVAARTPRLLTQGEKARQGWTKDMSGCSNSSSSSKASGSPGASPVLIEARKRNNSISSSSICANSTDGPTEKHDKSPSEQPVAVLSSDDLEEPQFELGFDFDEFDEEMVIGPSPPRVSSQSLSQGRVARLSLSAHASPSCSRRLGVRSSQNKKLPMSPQKWQNTNPTNDNEVAIPSSQAMQPTPVAAAGHPLSTLHADGDLSLGFGADQDLDDLDWTGLEQGLTCVPDSEAMCVPDSEAITCVADSEAMCPRSPHPVSGNPVMSLKSHSAALLPPSQSDARKRYSKLSSKKTSPEHSSIHNNKTDQKPPSPAARPLAVSPSRATDRWKTGFKRTLDSNMKPKPCLAWGEGTFNQKPDSAGEDSDFKTPIKAPLRNRKQIQVLISSDDDASPVKPLRARLKRSRPPLTDVGVSEEEDFIEPLAEVSRPAPVQSTARSNKRKRKHKGGHEFLEVEAELSGDSHSSDDSDHSDLDAMDASFINDETAMSQSCDDSVDTHAMYLKSMKDMAGPARYKLNYDAQHMDVFSQVPQQDSEYMEDSFVVHSAQESDVSGSSSEEMLVTEQSMMCGVRTRRARRLANVAASRMPAKSKRRVVQMVDSSSEEEGQGHCLEKTSLSEAGRPRKIMDESHAAQSKKPSKSRRLTVESSSSDNEDWDEFMTSINCSGLDESPSATTNRSCDAKTDPRKSTNVTPGGSFRPDKNCGNDVQLNIENCDNVNNPRHISCDNVISDHNRTDNETLRTNMSSQRSGRCRDMCTDKLLTFAKTSTVNSNVCKDPLGSRRNTVDLPESEPFTQIPSLVSRLRSRMAPAAVKSITSDRSTMQEGNASRPIVDSGMFDLDDGDLFGDEDDLVKGTEDTQYSESLLAPRNPLAPPDRSTLGNQLRTAQGKNPDVSVQKYSSLNRSSVNNKTSPTTDQDGMSAAEVRAERLRLSRLKQEAFKRKYAQQKSPEDAKPTAQVIPRSPSISPGGGQVKPLMQPPPSMTSSMAAPAGKVRSNPATRTRVSADASINSYAQGGCDKLLLLMDSREVNSAQDLVSCLRFDHKLEVAVRSLGICDYQVSNRMGIERKCHTDFICGTHRAKLMERLRTLCDHFDRPCLIVEQERLKKDEKPRKPPARTKYLDKLVASLAKTHIKVFYSSSQLSSASILQDLCHQESRKGQAISVPHNLTPEQDRVLGFYLSLPRVSYATALYLLHGNRTIADCINSSVSALSRQGCMSEQRATLVHSYLHHSFDTQMMAYKR